MVDKVFFTNYQDNTFVFLISIVLFMGFFKNLRNEFKSELKLTLFLVGGVTVGTVGT